MRTLTLSVCLALLSGTAGLALAPVAAQAQAPAKTVNMPATVYFAYDDDQLSFEMREYLDVVAARFAIDQPGAVLIRAHADRREAKTFGESHAVGLSQRRANVVREYLVQRGVPSGVITTEAFGHTRPSSETSTLGEDRRAQIEFKPGSGW